MCPIIMFSSEALASDIQRYTKTLVGKTTELNIEKHKVPWLTHISLASFNGTWVNRIAPDVTPQNASSHLGLFCLLMCFSSKNETKMKSYSYCPLKWKWTHPNDKDEKVHSSHSSGLMPVSERVLHFFISFHDNFKGFNVGEVVWSFFHICSNQLDLLCCCYERPSTRCGNYAWSMLNANNILKSFQVQFPKHHPYFRYDFQMLLAVKENEL